MQNHRYIAMRDQLLALVRKADTLVAPADKDAAFVELVDLGANVLTDVLIAHDRQAQALERIAQRMPFQDDLRGYTIGPLSKSLVFERAGLTNLADMQAVLDAVEAALVEQDPR